MDPKSTPEEDAKVTQIIRDALQGLVDSGISQREAEFAVLIAVKLGIREQRSREFENN